MPGRQALQPLPQLLPLGAAQAGLAAVSSPGVGGQIGPSHYVILRLWALCGRAFAAPRAAYRRPLSRWLGRKLPQLHLPEIALRSARNSLAAVFS